MAEDAGSVYSNIRILLNQLDQDLRQATQRFTNFNRNVESSTRTSSSRVQSAWMSAYVAVGLIADRVVRGIFNSFREAISVFAEFEQSIVNASTVIDTTEQQFEALEEAARRVGETTRLTASQAADALYELGSAGLSAEEAIVALDGVSALSIATQSSLAQSARLTIAAVNQFGLEFAQSTDVANTFVASITQTPATLDRLGNALQFVGPIAGGLGLQLEEVVGALGLLFEAGFSGEKAGRALRGAFIDLANEGSIVNRRLRDLGVTFDTINPATNNLAEIVDALAAAQIDASNAGAIFGRVVGPQLSVLIRDGGDAIREYTDNVTDTNRAFEIAEEQLDTLQGAFDELRSAAEAASITLIGSVAPGIESASDILRDFLRFVADAPDVLSAFITGLAGTGTAVVALGAALKVFGITLSAAFGPVGIAIAGAVGLTAAIAALARQARENNLRQLEQDTAQLRDSFDEATSAIEGTEGATAQFANRSVQNISQSFSTLLAGIEAGTITFRDLETATEALSEAYNISRTEVLRIALATSVLSEETERYLRSLILAEEAEEEREQLLQRRIETERAAARERQRASAAEARVSEEQQRILEEQLALLNTVFRNSAELYSVLGESYDSTSERANAFERALQTLIEFGLSAQSEAVQELISEYELLSRAYADSGSENLTEDQLAVLEATNDLRAAFEESAILVDQLGDSYDANQARINAFRSAISTLTDAGFTQHGTGIQALISLYERLQVQYADTAQGTNTLTDADTTFQDSLRDTIARIREETTELILNNAIRERIDGNIQESADLFQEAEQRKLDALQETFERDRELLLERIANNEAGEEELVALTRRLGLDRAAVSDEINRMIADAEAQSLAERQAELRRFSTVAISIFGMMGNVISQVFDNLLTNINNELFAVQERIDAINERIDDQIERTTETLSEQSELIQAQINAEREAEEQRQRNVEQLRENATQSELDRINTEDEAAEEAHEATIQRLEDQLAALQNRIDNEEQALEDQRERELAAEQAQLDELERRQRELRRREFEANKAISIIDTTIAGAVAGIRAYAELGPIAGAVAAGIIAGLTSASVALIASQQFPEYAAGGIEPSTPGGRLVRVAEAGNELMLSDGAQGQGLMQNFAQAIGSEVARMLGDMTVVVRVYTPDERFIQETVTRGTRSGVITVDPRSLRSR